MNTVASGSIANGATAGFEDTIGSNEGTAKNAGGAGMAWVPGRLGLGAVSLDGTDDYVDIGTGTDMDIGTGDSTMNVWVKFTSTTAGMTIFDMRNVSAHGYVLFTPVTGTNKIRAQWNSTGATAVNVDADNVSNDGLWHMATAVADRDGNLTLYIDGVSNGTPGSISGASADNLVQGINSSIGYHSVSLISSLVYFNGLITDARLYKRALSADDVKALFNYGRGFLN